jgi:endonuclease YncB( thermonuclease family)
MSPEKTTCAHAMSRSKRDITLLLCLPVLLSLILFDNICIEHKWQSQTSEDKQSQATDIQKYHTGTFAVINIVDGDTLDIDAPDGLSKYTRIRLLGIDAPEKNTDSGAMHFAAEATEFAQKAAFGKQVEIYLDQTNDTRGKYGRLLAYVKLPDGGFLNEILLSEGFAYADLRFHHSFYNKYKQLESRARTGNKGLWQNITPDRYPEWLRERKQL